MVLANSEDSISIGEGYRFFKRFYEKDTLCGCHEKIEECELWKYIDHYLKEHHSNYNPKFVWKGIQNLLLQRNFHKIPQLLQKDSNKDLGTIIANFYHAIFKKTKSKLIIDSSKNVGWLRILFELKIYDLQIIHLERNLEQVANSWKRKVLLTEYYNKEVYMPIKANFTIVKSWFKIKWNLKFFSPHSNYHFVCYEEFINNPKKFKDLFENLVFSEIDFNSLQVKPNHGIGGNPIRFSLSDRFEIKKQKSELFQLTKLERLLFQILRKLSL